MSYVPLNGYVFSAAYSGALAGMGASGQALTREVSESYAILSAQALAWAESFDTAWGAADADSYQVEAVSQMSQGAWYGRAPGVSPHAKTPASYDFGTSALVALIQTGSAWLAAKGIPIPPNGGGGGGDATSIKGVLLEPADTLGTSDVWVKKELHANLRAGRSAPLGWFDAEAIGAMISASNVWDGIQDDTAKLQEALDAPPKGGVVYLPAGNYFISAPLIVNGFGLDIRGCGALYNLDHSVVIHATAPMPYMLGVNNRSCVSQIFLDCALHGDYAVARLGDSASCYTQVNAWNAKIDGFHSRKVKEGWTIGAVVETGASPLLAVTGFPVPAYGGPQTLTITGTGALGAGAFTYDLGYGAVGPFTIPADGQFQLQLGANSVGAGILVTFPAGVYTAGDHYAWTITAVGCINDQARFTDCIAFGCGNVFATANFLLPGPGNGRDVYELVSRSINHSLVAGTVTITASSQTVTGVGTSFLASKIRPGDMIRAGAYPDWQPNHAYLLNDIVVAASAVPGQAYCWIAEVVSGNSAGTQPQWPTNSGVAGSMPIYQGVGTTIVDGGITWRCHNPVCYQVLAVRDNETIIISAVGTPINTQAGIDYALHVGSGFYEELSGDANTSIVDGGVYNSNAACGACCTADFTDHYLNGQYTDNGICGISVGIAGFGCYDTFITGTYMEGNLCANFIIGTASGINIISPIQVANNNMPVMDLGAVTTWGVWHGSNGYDSQVAQPIGTIARSDIGVTQSAPGKVFTARGPLVLVPNGQGLGDGTPSYNINPSSSLIYASINAPGGLVTANPTILPGLFAGQIITIVNEGVSPFTLDAAHGMSLEAAVVTVESTNAISLQWDGSLWRQTAFSRTVNRPHGITVVNGANNNVANPGDSVVDITNADVTLPFSITGIVAGYDHQELQILNLSTQTMTLANAAAGSAVGNKIQTATGADIVLTSNGYSSASLVYSVAAGAWLVTATA